MKRRSPIATQTRRGLLRSLLIGAAGTVSASVAASPGEANAASSAQSVHLFQRGQGIRWVSAGGSDRNDGLSPGTAMRQIHRALESLRGQTSRHIYVLAGNYEPFSDKGTLLTIEGVDGGTGESVDVGRGGVIIDVPSGKWGASLAVLSDEEVFQGATLKNLYFSGQRGAMGGVRIGRMSNFLLERVDSSNFEQGVGFRIEGSNSSQYGTMTSCQAFVCRTGIEIVDHNGLRIQGGTIEYLNGNRSSPEGSIGILAHRRSDTLRLWGTVIQWVETGVAISSTGALIDGIRLEAVSTGIAVSGEHIQIHGGSITNYITGGRGTGISIKKGSLNTVVLSPWVSNVRVPLIDRGENTLLLREQGLSASHVRVGTHGKRVELYSDGYHPGIRLGDHSLWVDDKGVLRIKLGIPTSAFDGSPVGHTTA